MTQVLTHAEGRKASWFELFFDLVFVTSVATLVERFAGAYDLAGAVEFGFLFLVLWWLWLGQAFHASRFDRDLPGQWAIGLAQMLAVVFIGHGAGDPFGERAWAFAGGVAAFKGLSMLAWLREIARPGLARLCTLYALAHGLQAALWAGSIWAPPGLRTVLWGAGLAIDVLTPFLVARETHRAPPHPEHLPERFGLFTLILLGETAAAAVHALDHGPLHADTLAVALLGVVLGFLYWLGYFHRARGQVERRVADAAAGRRLRLWAYGHIPLYLGIASLGAGVVDLAHHAALQGEAPWLFSGGAALAMAGVTLISLANAAKPARAGWRFVPLALVAALAPAGVATAPALLAVTCACAGAQIGLSLAMRGARA